MTLQLITKRNCSFTIADLVAGDYIAYGALEANDSSGGHFGSMSVFKDINKHNDTILKVTRYSKW